MAGVHLRSAVLSPAEINETNSCWKGRAWPANLARADLRNAFLTGIDLTGATIDKTELTGNETADSTFHDNTGPTIDFILA